METTINERLMMLITHFTKGRKNAFADLVGISNQALGELTIGRQGTPSFKLLQGILKAFPAVDAEWLVMGRGPMFRGGEDLSAPLTTEDRLQAIEAEIAQIRSTL
jgi:transcriptional regulator with XRE-family HTH domain